MVVPLPVGPMVGEGRFVQPFLSVSRCRADVFLRVSGSEGFLQMRVSVCVLPFTRCPWCLQPHLGGGG